MREWGQHSNSAFPETEDIDLNHHVHISHYLEPNTDVPYLLEPVTEVFFSYSSLQLGDGRMGPGREWLEKSPQLILIHTSLCLSTLRHHLVSVIST